MDLKTRRPAPFIPAYPGKGRLIRFINAGRRKLPRATHFVEAVLRVRINERHSSLTWIPLLWAPDPAGSELVSEPTLKETLPKLVAAGGWGVAVVGGLAYRVRPTRGEFIHVGDTVSRRSYASYEDYVRHQSSKLERETKFIRQTSDKRHRHMLARFTEVSARAHLSGVVLCLGARLGEEVRAFRDLGMTAVGIDLNPGEQNPYCMYGDFHNLLFPHNAFDVVYSNVLDHVYDMKSFMREVVRVTRPTGKIYFDLTGGYAETVAIDPYGATFWPTNASLVEVLRPYIARIVLDIEGREDHTRRLVFHPCKSSLGDEPAAG